MEKISKKEKLLKGFVIYALNLVCYLYKCVHLSASKGMDKNVCSYTIHNSSKVKIQMFINSRIEIIVYLYNVLKN